jgi:hypothetical protein
MYIKYSKTYVVSSPFTTQDPTKIIKPQVHVYMGTEKHEFVKTMDPSKNTRVYMFRGTMRPEYDLPYMRTSPSQSQSNIVFGRLRFKTEIIDTVFEKMFDIFASGSQSKWVRHVAGIEACVGRSEVSIWTLTGNHDDIKAIMTGVHVGCGVTMEELEFIPHATPPVDVINKKTVLTADQVRQRFVEAYRFAKEAGSWGTVSEQLSNSVCEVFNKLSLCVGVNISPQQKETPMDVSSKQGQELFDWTTGLYRSMQFVYDCIRVFANRNLYKEVEVEIDFNPQPDRKGQQWRTLSDNQRRQFEAVVFELIEAIMMVEVSRTQRKAGIVDVHGIHAQAGIRSMLSLVQQAQPGQEVQFITGHGRSSPSGRSVQRDGMIELLNEAGIQVRYDQSNGRTNLGKLVTVK